MPYLLVKPLSLIYYVYFMNTASSSRSWGAKKDKSKKTFAIPIFAPPGISFCIAFLHVNLYGLNYHLYFMNTASSSRSNGGANKKSVANMDFFWAPPPPA